MSLHQYIGARYVPRFRDTYDPTTVYEALDVVDNGAGTSYIARIPTGPGVPLTDTTHWALYGASSSAIIDLQDQIDTIVNTTIPGVVSDYQDADDVIVNTDIPTAIGALGTRINPITRPTLFVGDSYGDGNSEFIKSAINDLGMTHAHNLATSGAGFTKGTGGNGFLDQIQTYAGDKDEIEAIYVLGGLNDSTSANMSDPTTLQTNMAAFASYAHTNYPNAKLYLGYCGNGLDGKADVGTYTYVYRRFCAYTYKRDANFIHIDMQFLLNGSPLLMDSGGAHPSTAGQNVLKNALITAIMGYQPIAYYPRYDATFTHDGVIATAHSGNVHTLMNGGFSEIEFTDNFNVSIAPGTILSHSDIKIGEINNVWLNRPITCNVDLVLNNFNYQWANATGQIYITHNEVYLRTLNIKGDHTGYAEYTADTGAKIYFPGITRIPLDSFILN